MTRRQTKADKAHFAEARRIIAHNDALFEHWELHKTKEDITRPCRWCGSSA